MSRILARSCQDLSGILNKIMHDLARSCRILQDPTKILARSCEILAWSCKILPRSCQILARSCKILARSSLVLYTKTLLIQNSPPLPVPGSVCELVVVFAEPRAAGMPGQPVGNPVALGILALPAVRTWDGLHCSPVVVLGHVGCTSFAVVAAAVVGVVVLAVAVEAIR